MEKGGVTMGGRVGMKSAKRICVAAPHTLPKAISGRQHPRGIGGATGALRHV